MRNYETVLIIRPGQAAESELTAIIDKYSGVITTHGGEIAGADRWGLKKLAYPIKKETQGVYVLLRFSVEPAGLKEMERLLRIDDRILKYLTVKLDDNMAPFVPGDDSDNGDEDDFSHNGDDSEQE